ncbi:MAG: SUMF1/EgtB/PvdO family nonheme iron enzyme [Oligoflexia bacterium]|nr:SUMF1/EgtB/PvdO family nonheme iron enzyme [Oligoflexia bacterium]
MLGTAGLVVAAATGLAMAEHSAVLGSDSPSETAQRIHAEPTAAQPTAAELPAAAPPATALTCPAGMVLIDAAIIQIGQPERKSWPAPTGPLRPTQVDTFCIDKTERSREDFMRWPDSAQVRDDGCDWRRGGDSTQDGEKPVVCITRAEARNYCAAVIAGGRLPGLMEWESAARADNRQDLRISLSREWIADDFPPAALDRAWTQGDHPAQAMFRQKWPKSRIRSGPTTGQNLFSWNRRDSTQRLRNLGFRCATQSSPDGPTRLP